MSFSQEGGRDAFERPDSQAGQAERLSQDILRLRARALRHGYLTVAEALRLAQDMMEMGAELPSRSSNVHPVYLKRSDDTE